MFSEHFSSIDFKKKQNTNPSNFKKKKAHFQFCISKDKKASPRMPTEILMAGLEQFL